MSAALLPRRSGVRRRSGALAVFAAFALCAPVLVAAEPGVSQVPLPPGLAALWRVDGRKIESRASAWSLAAFSTDGKLLGIGDDKGTRIYRVTDGELVRSFPVPMSTGQFAYSLAISSTGLVAIGRVGGVDVHSLASRREAWTFHCRGVCGPVTAVAFSPNGSWLAYQSARGSLEVASGLVEVVDVQRGARIAALEASATRAGVMFTADGRALTAANVTRVGDLATFGLRGWSGAANWRLTRDVAGALPALGAIGPYAFDERVAAYARDGRIELRDVATGSLVWAVPLVPPGLDSLVSDSAMKLELAAFSQSSGLLLSYESPVSGDAPGAIVLRRVADGEVVAMYDVAGVNALAVSPDGEAFAYTTGAGRTYTAVARIPR